MYRLSRRDGLRFIFVMAMLTVGCAGRLNVTSAPKEGNKAAWLPCRRSFMGAEFPHVLDFSGGSPDTARVA
jgi:hypothetical protein